MKYYLLSIMLFLLAGCQLHDDNSPNAVDKPLNAWAEAYFTFNYEDALEYMTPESEKWIRFAATNITEKDIDFIKGQNNVVKIEILDRQITADTTCVSRIRVSDFVQLRFVGQDSKVVDKAEFQIPLVKRDGKWLVRMEGQLQSGKQSRD
jgi:hypothetical protein